MLIVTKEELAEMEAIWTRNGKGLLGALELDPDTWVPSLDDLPEVVARPLHFMARYVLAHQEASGKLPDSASIAVLDLSVRANNALKYGIVWLTNQDTGLTQGCPSPSRCERARDRRTDHEDH